MIISICWANNDNIIEPFVSDRFANIDLLKDCKNISLNWYPRPLVREWSNNFDYLDEMFRKISSKYADQIDSIIPGGLRWTEGIEYGMTEVRDLSLPSNVSSASRHSKTLTDSDFVYICKLAEKYFPETPLYKHSSCELSQVLNTNNICLTNFLKVKDCKMSICTERQRELCQMSRDYSLAEINQELNRRGIEISIKEVHFDRP